MRSHLLTLDIVKILVIAILCGILFTGCGKVDKAGSPDSISEPEMVYVDGGFFMMGYTDYLGNDYHEDEFPVTRNKLTSYSISKYEVTQKLWKQVMGTSLSQQRNLVNKDLQLFGEGDDYPMYYVNYDDVQEFISRLNKATGKQYRLPTEAEWEYAARGGIRSKNTKFSGSKEMDSVGWYGENSGDTAHPVGSKLPNELGIYDMSGNVYEWCSDWYAKYEWGSWLRTNPTGPEEGEYRVIRGGSWADNTDGGSRVWSRGNTSSEVYGNPNYRCKDIGFRLVLADEQSIQKEPREQPSANTNSTEPEMVFVQGGTYKMRESSDYEGDSITVGDFYIGKYEITQKQWQDVMGTTIQQQTAKANRDSPNMQDGEEVDWSIGSIGDNYPMYFVNWEEINEFCTRLSEMTGKKYRLPTEAEWEYAARGGAKSKGYLYSGSNDIDDVAWYFDNSKMEHYPVGTLQPNELGVHDMSGNVFEWCDEYPRDDLDGHYRAIRGGACMPEYGWNGDDWANYIPYECTVWGNSIQYIVHRTNITGFRIAREP